jgi:hypothetical protein
MGRERPREPDVYIVRDGAGGVTQLAFPGSERKSQQHEAPEKEKWENLGWGEKRMP